jgi:hypothetical protein
LRRFTPYPNLLDVEAEWQRESIFHIGSVHRPREWKQERRKILMRRLLSNRWWALFLALGVCLASMLPATKARAFEGQIEPGDGNPLGGGGSVGDPDEPYGRGNGRLVRGALLGGPGMTRAAGDSVAPSRNGMWRFIVVWSGFRSWLFRF